jgi:hypothetical protein
MPGSSSSAFVGETISTDPVGSSENDIDLVRSVQFDFHVAGP